VKFHLLITLLYVRYRVGGGEDSNIGVNVINNLGTINAVINGDSSDINRIIRNSISVNNPIPALGGKSKNHLLMKLEI
jgi:hypothetical protein